METKTRNSPTTSNSPKPKASKPTPPSYSAQEKAQAVLQLWTERCKGSDLCRQFKINWVTLQQWQHRAMEGMLQALEPRLNLTKGQALSPRLLALLQKRQTNLSAHKLVQRLEQIQLAKTPEVPPQTQ